MTQAAVQRLVGHPVNYLEKVKDRDGQPLWIAVGRTVYTIGHPFIADPVRVTVFWPLSKKIAGILRGMLVADQTLLRLVYLPGDGKHGSLQIVAARRQEITLFHWRLGEQIVYSRSKRLPRPLELLTDSERASEYPIHESIRDAVVGYLRLRRLHPDNVKNLT